MAENIGKNFRFIKTTSDLMIHVNKEYTNDIIFLTDRHELWVGGTLYSLSSEGILNLLGNKADKLPEIDVKDIINKQTPGEYNIVETANAGSTAFNIIGKLIIRQVNQTYEYIVYGKLQYQNNIFSYDKDNFNIYNKIGNGNFVNYKDGLGNISGTAVGDTPDIDANISTGGTLNSIGLKVLKDWDEPAYLKIYGHEKLLEAGYVPYIWRYIKTSRKKNIKMDENGDIIYKGDPYYIKGWCTYGSYHCVNITDDGIVEFSTNDKHSLNAPTEGFSSDAENFVSYTEGLGGIAIAHGSKAIYNTNRRRTIHIPYAIGFARPKHLRERISEADLVSNLVEFYVIYGSADNNGDEYGFTFGLKKTC